VWKSDVPLNETEAIKGWSGVVAPVLAGFALATVGVLRTAGDHAPRLTDAATLLLTAAAVVFLASMELGFMAVRYGATPQDYLDWDPAARTDQATMERVQLNQSKDRRLWRIYFRRARFFYNAGILAILAGLGTLLVPAGWSIGSAMSVGLAVIALLAGAAWILGWPARGRIAPGYAEVDADAKDAVTPLPANWPDLVK
jgi:hypothetical protein